MHISEHQLTTFHIWRSDFSRAPQTTLHNLFSKKGWVQRRQQSQDRQRFALREAPAIFTEEPLKEKRNQQIWQPQKVKNVKADFYPALYKLLRGEQENHCKIYHLSEDAKNALKPKRRCLALVLTPKAEKRLMDVDGTLGLLQKRGKNIFFMIDIGDISLYHFSTGIFVCQFTIKIKIPKEERLTGTQILEAADRVSRFSQLSWYDLENNTLEKVQDGFTIGSLSARLVFGTMGEMQYAHRNYTYTYAKLDLNLERERALEEMNILGVRLARLNTMDYDIDFSCSQCEQLLEYNNVKHYVTREGAASLVVPITKGESVPFLEQFLPNSIVSAYLPIVLLNLHLLALCVETSEAMFDVQLDDNSSELEEILRRWRDIRDEIAQNNTRFRLRNISQLGIHNRYNVCLRQAFGLDESLDQHQQHLSDIEHSLKTQIEWLERKEQAALERKLVYYRVFVSTAIVGLAVLEIMELLEKIIIKDTPMLVMDYAKLLLLLCLAIFFFYFEYKRTGIAFPKKKKLRKE